MNIKHILSIIVALGLLSTTSFAQGTFGLFDTVYSGETPDSVAPPYASILIDQYHTDTVRLIFFSLIPKSYPEIFISKLGLNYTGDLSTLSLQIAPRLFGQFAIPTIGTEGDYPFGGGGYYDIQLNFSTANTSLDKRFNANDILILYASSPGIQPSHFNKLSSPHGGNGIYVSAIKVQGYDGSCWVGDSISVPEPAVFALAGLGIASLVILRKRQ